MLIDSAHAGFSTATIKQWLKIVMLKNIPDKTKSASTGFEPAEGGAVPPSGAKI